MKDKNEKSKDLELVLQGFCDSLYFKKEIPKNNMNNMAIYFDTTRQTIYNYIKKGYISFDLYRKLDNNVFIKIEDKQNFMRANVR